MHSWPPSWSQETLLLHTARKIKTLTSPHEVMEGNRDAVV